jgi:hypothetical protein
MKQFFENLSLPFPLFLTENKRSSGYLLTSGDLAFEIIEIDNHIKITSTYRFRSYNNLDNLETNLRYLLKIELSMPFIDVEKRSPRILQIYVFISREELLAHLEKTLIQLYFFLKTFCLEDFFKTLDARHFFFFRLHSKTFCLLILQKFTRMKSKINSQLSMNAVEQCLLQ